MRNDRTPSVAYFFARPFVRFVERYYPDAFIFVILLTLITFACAITFTETSPAEALEAWGSGLGSLMSFTAQLAITLITAHVLAHTRLIQSGLKRLSRVPRKTWQAYFLVSVAAGLASLIAWPLGLVAGATLAKRISIEGAKRGLALDYPLLVAAAYSGFVVWHMGYSGSAPLFVATPGHAMEPATGIVPVSQTIFSAWNILTAITVLVVVSTVCALMQPPEDLRRPAQINPEPDASRSVKTSDTLGSRISNSRWISLVFGALLLAYLTAWFSHEGFSLNLDIVNWSLLAAGLVLVRSPAHYVDLALDGGRSIGALLIQYPFYAGIMSLMAGTGLVGLMSDGLSASSSAITLPIFAFLSAGLINIFVPSGGGQWAIQGPVFVDAANQLGLDPSIIVMAVAYGDQWTNMIQPFWTIPLLALAGLKVRDVMGYTFVTLLVSAPIFVAGLMLAVYLT